MGAAASVEEGGGGGEGLQTTTKNEQYSIEGADYIVNPDPGGKAPIPSENSRVAVTDTSFQPQPPNSPPPKNHHSVIIEVSSPQVTSKSISTNNNNTTGPQYLIETIVEPPPISSSKTQMPKSSFVPAATEPDEEDINPLDILFQFIPYYSQGDPSNDSIVRSTLSGLPVEDVDTKDEYGNTLLLVACQYRCEDLARIILNKGADPNALNASGACSLHFTCYRESASRSLAKILLQNGANPEIAETSYGCTPLHYCAGTGDVDFCKMLISYGASVSTYDYYNYTCVDYAREAGMQQCANYLQQKLLESGSSGTAFRTSSGRNLNALKSGYGSAFSAAQMNSGVGGSSAYGSLRKEGIAAPLTEGEWQVQVDPQSGQKYYTHMGTGESLWEKEYRTKKDSEDKYLLLGEETPGLQISAAEPKHTSPPRPASFSKMDRPMTSAGSSGGGGGMTGMDPNILQNLLNEAKIKNDGLLEAERASNRVLISAKDGKIAKLEAVVETLIREGEKLEV